MDNDSTRQSVLFEGLCDRPVIVKFDELHGSSDGGAVLLKAADARFGLTGALAACIRDDRHAGKIAHSVADLLRQRVFGIACGYADANDAARLSGDPVHKLLLDRDPLEGMNLASQPTLSRFENAVGPKVLYRMGEAIAETVIERHRQRLGRKVKRVTIDMDPTDDPTHGSQQLTFFNGHYDTWCYLPMMGFLSFNSEAQQYAFCGVLRPGNAPASLGALGILRRVIVRLRQAFGKARIRVRLDGGFATPELFDYLEGERVEYVVAMGKNAVLARAAEDMMARVRARSAVTGESEQEYGECRYAAGKWRHERRVVIKAEVVRHPGRSPKDNQRFVVTNLKLGPKRLYATVYCGRGDVENRIKELHYGLALDRTSCSRFWANQLRVLMTVAAYVLMQEIRLCARRSGCACAQVSTLRERLIKLGARIERSVRRIVIHLPQSAAYNHDWWQIARSLGAAPS